LSRSVSAHLGFIGIYLDELRSVSLRPDTLTQCLPLL
jgi:hypothetical protein